MIKCVCSFFLAVLCVPALGMEPFTIMQGADRQAPKQPQACIARNGCVHVTFGIGDQVYYCNIENDTTSNPRAVFSVPNMSLGMRRGPRIAHSGAAIVITAIGGEVGKGRDGDILAYRSVDNGKSWSGPVEVNDVDASAREGLHAMTAAEDGTLWCVWLDLRERGTQLFAAKSVDNGAAWSTNVLVYRSPDGSVCECCHPSIVATKDSLHVLFRNSLKGNRDMYLVSSTDAGTTFDGGVRLGRANWQLNACPMDGGMLAMDKNQNISTVWRRDRSIVGTGSVANSEEFLGTGEQPWITNSDDGFYSVWTSKRDGELLLSRPGSTDGERLSMNASFPIIVASPQPNSTVYLFWEARTGQAFSIIGQRIR